ncbi:hypothetical protein DL767_005999 [Monosporascus sp. MG133]|nr:hypothetical protein DL767_005999 [Monosporascus sp. MG133]
MSNASNGSAQGIPDLLALADNIMKKTKALSEYLEANNLATPYFATNSCEPPETPEYIALYDGLKTSLEYLGRLFLWPEALLRSFIGLDADRIARIMRMLITHGVFQEHRPGSISHSAASMILRNDEDLRCAGLHSLDEMAKAATATAERLRESPQE